MQALLCLKLCSRKNDKNEYRECVREQRPICFSSLNRCIRPGGLADRAAFSYTDLERMAGERMITVAVCDDNIPVLEKLAAMLKELMRKDMEDVLRRLAREFQQERLLRLETAYHVAEYVRVREIIYLYSERNYVIYMLTENRRVKVRRALQECGEELGGLGFLRVHRSFLVNMEHIKNISRRDNSICLSNGEMLEIGRTYKDEIEERFLTWLQKGTEHG